MKFNTEKVHERVKEGTAKKKMEYTTDMRTAMEKCIGIGNIQVFRKCYTYYS